MELDFSTVPQEDRGEFELLPDEWYRVRVIEADETDTTITSPGINVTLEVQDGKYKNRRIWDTLWATEKSMSWLRDKLTALGYPLPEGRFSLNPQDLVGRVVNVRTAQEPRRDDPTKKRVNVKAYEKAVSGDLPTGEDWREMVPAAAEDDAEIPF